MDWPSKREEIQDKYFFQGSKTHLCVHAETGYVTWVFTFQDFGMFHTLCSSSDVRMQADTGHYIVNGMEYASEALAMDSVFKHHLKVFIHDLYDELGVEQEHDTRSHT